MSAPGCVSLGKAREVVQGWNSRRPVWTWIIASPAAAWRGPGCLGMGGPVRDEGDAGEGALPRIAPAVVVNSDSVVAEQIAELMQLGGGEFSPGVADLPVEPLAVACRARWVAARHAGDDEATTPAPSGLPVGHSRPTRPARRHPLAAAVSQANASGATDQHGSVA